MNKYIINDESRTTLLSLSEKCKALEHTHSELKSHAEAAMKEAARAQESADEASSYAEDACGNASAADDDCDDAERTLREIIEAIDDIVIKPYESETELEKLLKLTGLSVFNLKRILKEAPEEEESERQFATS